MQMDSNQHEKGSIQTLTSQIHVQNAPLKTTTDLENPQPNRTTNPETFLRRRRGGGGGEGEKNYTKRN